MKAELRLLIPVLASLVLAVDGSDRVRLWAQVPAISATSPQAAQPGATVDVKLQGGNLTGATALWTSFPGQTVLAPDVADNGKNNGEVVFRLTLPADAPVGVHGIRVATATGVSPLKLFVVDELTSVTQKSGNHSPAKAQSLELPCAVDGRVDALTRHYYRFPAESGEQISFEVLARRIGSALDPMIRILDAAGHELTYSDDAPGLSSDAQICHTFDTTGKYVLEVRDINYQGGGNYHYRLRIGDFPCVTVPYPMGVQAGVASTVHFAGPDVDEVLPIDVHVAEDPLLSTVNVGAKRRAGAASGFAILAVGRGEELLEHEPNDTAAQANRVTLGTCLNGRFESADDVDRFVFPAKKDQRFVFAGITRRQGSPAYLVLQLLNPNGGEVASAEYDGSTDGAINYTFPADGDYTLVVKDLAGQNGNPFAYRIDVQPWQPGFSLTASTDTLNVPVEGTAIVTVTASRRQYDGPIDIAAINLPQGLISTPTVIGPGMNQAVLTVTATAEAATVRLLPVTIVGTALIGQGEFQTTASISAALKGRFHGMPWPPQLLQHSVAAAVGPKPQLVLRAEPTELVFGRDLKATVKIIAERADGFDDQIALKVTPEKGGLPAGISVAAKPIPKAENEIEVVFSANGKAPLGEFTAVLSGTLKKDKTTVTQAAPGFRLKLQPPFVLKLDAADSNLAPGGQMNVKVTAQRNPAYHGAIALSFQNLPKGVVAADATIPEGQDEVAIVITAADDTQPAAVNNVTVQGTGQVEKAKLTAVSAAVTLTVE